MNAATDTLFSTLTSCLDHICPLSSRPARAAPSNPWLSDVLHEHRSKLRAAERKWHKSNDPSVSLSLCFHLSLLKSILPRSHISTTRSTAHLTHAISSKHSNLSSVYTSRNRWQNITYSSTWQRLSFLSSLPLQLYRMISSFSWVLLQLPHQLRSEILVLFSMTSWLSKTTLQKLFDLALHNIRKIRPFLTQHAAQLLVQAIVISRLDYCNALLAGLPSNTIKPLQMIQNAVAWLVFSEPKRAHVTPLFISLHWLPVAARIKFKTLMLAYRTATGSAPSYFHSLMTIYIPSRILRSASERHLVVPSQRGTKSLSVTGMFHRSWLVE